MRLSRYEYQWSTLKTKYLGTWKVFLLLQQPVSFLNSFLIVPTVETICHMFTTLNSIYEFLYNSLVIKLQSLRCPWCACSCLSWVRRLRLYFCDAADCGVSSWCRVFSQTADRLPPLSACQSLARQVGRSHIDRCGWEMRLRVGGPSPWYTRSTRVMRTSAVTPRPLVRWRIGRSHVMQWCRSMADCYCTHLYTLPASDAFSFKR